MPTLTFAAANVNDMINEVGAFFLATNGVIPATPQPQTLDDAIAWANATFPLPEGFAVGVVDLKVNNLTPALPDDVVLATEQAPAETPARKRNRGKAKSAVNVVTQDERNDETGDTEGGSVDDSGEAIAEPADPFAPAITPNVINAAPVINWTPAQYLDKSTALARKVFEKSDLAKAEVTALVKSFNVEKITLIPEDRLAELWAGVLNLSQKYTVVP